MTELASLRLVLLARVGDTPLGGAWFSVTLPMKTKNPYRLLFGPASANGTFVLTGAEILDEVQKVRDLFVMDYVDPSLGWTGVVEISGLNRSDIANVLSAYDIYGASGVYPPNLPEELTTLEVTLDEHEGEEISVDVSPEAGGALEVRTHARVVD